MADRRLACVRWSDAHGNAMTTYEAHEVPHAPAVVETYGLIIRRDDAGITLANEVFEAGSFRGVTFIPAGMINDVRFYHASRRATKPAPVATVLPGRDPGPAHE